MSERRATSVAIGVVITSTLFRLVTLQWLHPLNWDEIEYYRATRWIAEGRLPFRDFWEHHPPLAWFFYAPFSRLTDSPGVAAIIVMRWAQVPVWIATFWLANVFMRNLGIARFPRWAAMAIATSSTFLMNPAVEFRVDPLACALLMGALVLWQRESMFAAGVLFGLAGLTNMRLIPVIVVAALFLRVVNAREHAWRGDSKANRIFAGGAATVIAFLLYGAVTGSLQAMADQLIVENAVGDKAGVTVIGGFAHRILALFGVRVMGSDRPDIFEPAAIDAGGITIVLLGAAGLFLALRRWRAPDALFVIGFISLVNVLFTASMNFVYIYHFGTVIVLALPLLATIVERIPRRGIVIGILAIVWCVNAFASLFRGKELDLAYQDLIMRDLHARTRPGEAVFAGIPWALRREPAYHLWFLPDMTKHIVWRGYEPPYKLSTLTADPPAAVVVDHSVMVWTLIVQRELAPFIARHYIPLWGQVWVPGMSARLKGDGGVIEWIVPRDGTYRLFATPELARHLWFVNPYYLAATDATENLRRFTVTLPEPAAHPQLEWWIDRQPANIGATVTLRKGQRIAVAYAGATSLGVILLPGNDRVLFRQPPAGATLEASGSRVTHVPRLGVRIE
jgi:hypothetical protein